MVRHHRGHAQRIRHTPPHLLKKVENFIEENEELEYTTREEFIRDATRGKLALLTDQFEYIEIDKREYDTLNTAIEEMGLPFTAVGYFIGSQIDNLLEEYHTTKELTQEKGNPC